MSQGPTAPEATESHPYGFPFTTRFPGCKQVSLGEGISIYTADTADRFQVIVDSGTLADFLDPEVDADILGALVTVHHFNGKATRDRFVAQRYRRPGGTGAK